MKQKATLLWQKKKKNFYRLLLQLLSYRSNLVTVILGQMVMVGPTT